MEFKTGLDVRWLAVTGFVGVLLAIVAIISMEALTNEQEQTQFNEVANQFPANQWVMDLKKGQRENIERPETWVDKSAGIVSVPIDLAMKKLVELNGVLPPLPATQPTTEPSVK